MSVVKFKRNEIVSAELREFAAKIEAYQNRQMDADEFKHRRLLQGVYGQRQPALFMMRVKIPGGNIDQEMLTGLSSGAEKFGKPLLHITTRQDVQLYNIKINNIIPLLEHLADYGITTREASGATMRNMIASPFAGFLRDQAFDVRPVIEGFSRFFMRHPDTQHLPRKFKLSFSDNESDYAISGMHDLGFIARIKDGKPGFKVFIGGSLGSTPVAGRLYKDFLPLEESLLHTLGILRAFDKHGDRSKRFEARLKFQLDKIGYEKFLGYANEEIQKLKDENYAFPHLEAKRHQNENFNFENPFNLAESRELFHWYKNNVIPTPRKNEYMILVRVPLGDLSVEVANILNKQHSEWFTNTDGNYITLADSQNLVLKGIIVPESDKADFFRTAYDFLKQHNLNGIGHKNFGDVLSCVGTASCAAGITHSPGLGEALTDRFQNLWLDDPRFENTLIHISGCANSCARHNLATLGFSGRADTEFAENQHAPAYNVFYGGAALSDGNIRLGRKITDKLLAKRVPKFIERVIEYFEQNADESETFPDYLARISDDEMNRLVDEFSLEKMPASREEELEFDWGKDTPYVMQYGEGECS